MLTIYHNPRCKKSRAGLAFLQDHDLEHRVRLYLKDALSKEELRRLLNKTDLPVEQLVRKQEEKYRKELKGKEFTDEQWLEILAENPRLLQRPIVEEEHIAVLGDPVENLQRFQ